MSGILVGQVGGRLSPTWKFARVLHMKLGKTEHDIFFAIKIALLAVAVILLVSAVSDLLATMSPANCSTGGACIKISQTAVLIQGVNFVGTLWDAVFASVATVTALILDVIEHMAKD